MIVYEVHDVSTITQYPECLSWYHSKDAKSFGLILGLLCILAMIFHLSCDGLLLYRDITAPSNINNVASLIPSFM